MWLRTFFDGLEGQTTSHSTLQYVSSMNRFRYLLMQISELKRKPDWEKVRFLGSR